MKMADEIDVQNVCRICLRLKNLMISLEHPFIEKDQASPSIQEILEYVYAMKLKFCYNYPANICNICLKELKTAYQFKQHLLNTEGILKHLINFSTCTSQEEFPVEVIVGKNKFCLNDILIVEEEKFESKNYNGFLNNLGKAVSASFVEKKDEYETKRILEENPIVVIEKLKLQKHSNIFNKIKQKNKEKFVVENFKFNVNESDLKCLTEIDKEIFKSALNIHLKCNICQKLYSKKWKLLKHLETCEISSNEGKQKNPSNPYFLCPYCRRMFKENTFLHRHIKKMHNTLYTCGICQATFHNRNKYAYHRSTKHSKDVYICQYCGKKFITKSSLNIHTLRHTHRNKTQCICPVCGKTFHYSGGLFYHMKIHRNERNYSCLFCDKKFYSATAQKRHIRTHTGERPYNCNICEKRFFSSSELRKHQYLHTGNMPYYCQYCSKGFTCKYNLHRHIIKHPGNYKCEICNKDMISFEVLKIHSHFVHKEKVNKQ